jgi:hypothetical protein
MTKAVGFWENQWVPVKVSFTSILWLWNGRGGSEVSTARVFREDFSVERV